VYEHDHEYVYLHDAPSSAARILDVLAAARRRETADDVERCKPVLQVVAMLIKMCR
jgi:hypothetical protein